MQMLVAQPTLTSCSAAMSLFRTTSPLQPLELDPASAPSVEAAAAKLRETRDGKLGAIVNNAGMADKEWTQEVLLPAACRTAALEPMRCIANVHIPVA